MSKKPSDIFNGTNFVFGSKSDFKDAYPEIQDMSIHVREPNLDEGTGGTSSHTRAPRR